MLILVQYGFVALMGFAAATDLLMLRIHNLTNAAIALLFVISALALRMSAAQVTTHVLTAFGVLAVTLFFFARGWIGGGDAKLAAAMALWFGPDESLIMLFALTGIFGGVLSLVILGYRAWPLHPLLMRFNPFRLHHSPKSGVPYGIVLGAAGIYLFDQSAVGRLLTLAIAS